MRHASWVLAYHGCDKKVGESILAGEADVLASTNDYDWLGSGAYFWENSYSRALAWAHFLKAHPGLSKGGIESPFVIGAIIDPGNCLDLSEDGSLRILKEAHAFLSLVFEYTDRKLPKNEKGHSNDADLVKRKLDCAVINFLHRLREEQKEPAFDTIRCPFMEGGPLFHGSQIQAKTHLQWCVRNPKTHIRGYFRPRQLE